MKETKTIETLCGHRAIFSEDRKYRYALFREWDAQRGFVTFVLLNPSTADEQKDDATIRRCINFAKSWGYGGIIVLNLFAYRATDPKIMKKQDDPIGSENNILIMRFAQSEQSCLTVAAWGNDGAYLGRSDYVKSMLSNLHYLKLTKSSEPAHPLYLKSDVFPVPFQTLRIYNDGYPNHFGLI